LCDNARRLADIEACAIGTALRDALHDVASGRLSLHIRRIYTYYGGETSEFAAAQQSMGTLPGADFPVTVAALSP
jgi:hypothetical protein